MNHLDINSTLSFSQIELKHAENILSRFGYDQFDSDDSYLSVVYDKEFRKKDRIVRKLKHLDCRFVDFTFDGTDGTSSLLFNCKFLGCTIKNAGFDFSDFTNSSFVPLKQNTKLVNSSFRDSDFMGAKFRNVDLEACSLQNTLFEDAYFETCTFHCCNLEGSIFRNTSFISTNMISACIDFSEFEDVIIDNAIFSFFGILWSFGGLQIIKEFADTVKLGLPSSDTYITGKEFLMQLNEFEPFFYYKKDYFSIVNINIFLGEHNKAYLYVMEGLIYYFYEKNFRMLKYLCKLASKNNFFTKEQLNQLYYSLQKNAVSMNMTCYEHNNYLRELEEIKKLLIDNPYGQSQIIINIATSIEEQNLLSELLIFIDKVMLETVPTSTHYIEIRHNSPFSLEILDSDNIQNLLNLLLSLISGIWGQTPQFNALLSAWVNLKKIGIESKTASKEQKELDLELKREELLQQRIATEKLYIEKKKQEAELEQTLLETEKRRRELEHLPCSVRSKSEVLSFDEKNIAFPVNIKGKIINITYIINSDEALPNILRENVLYEGGES